MAPEASLNKQQVNVRVSPRTRAALEAAAEGSDRTVSQLVRYAVTDWVADPEREFPVVSSGEATVQVRVRLDAADVDAIDAICDETGVKRSVAVRHAIVVWLARVGEEGAPVLLGAPFAGLAGLGADAAVPEGGA